MRKTILAAISFVCVVCASAQEVKTDLEQIVGRMNHVALFQKTYPQEKVYLHFDNTGYFEDERMYFKCYVTRSDNGKPSNISKVMYVDLVNPSGNVVKRRKLKLENGEAHGDILLDSIYTTGFFEVRAYTRYMLNFGDDACFSRVFPVFNKPSADGDYRSPQIDQLSYHQRLPERFFETDSIATLDPVKQKKRKSRGYTVNVYPEGGKLVKGLYSRVAFTVSDEEHKPVSLAGEVDDAEGNTLAIVVSDSTGRGFFDIIPTGGPLTMVLTTPDTKKIEFEMPDVLDEGLVLNVDPISEDVGMRILSTAGMRGMFIGMTVMNNGNIYLTDTLSLTEEYARRLPRNRLRPGVNQLTLVDAAGHIHAERLFFVCPKPDALDTVSVNTSSVRLSPCGKVRLDLHTLPNAHLSFSAMDYGGLVNGPHGNINTYMLLGSDIAGYIPHPEYYFEADDAIHRLAADSLMLFNGWRRYDWEVMSDMVPWRQRIQQVEDGLYVYGHLKPSWKKLVKKNPVGDVDMTLYIYNKEGKNASGETRTDSTGFYAFRLPDDVYGDFNMQILTKIEDKLKTYQVTIDRQFEPQPRFIGVEEASSIALPSFSEKYKVDAASFEKMDNERMKMLQTGVGQYALSTATIKARKPSWKVRRNPAWDEYNARYHANLYYNVSGAAEDIADKGEVIPRYDEWLASVNNMLNGPKTFVGTIMIELETGQWVGSNDPEGKRPFDINDYSYGGRNIIWMLDNRVAAITGKLKKYDPVLEEYVPYVPEAQLNELGFTHDIAWPTVFKGYIDELQSMYVWTNQKSSTYAVVVYMFTRPYVSTESKKGRRITYFHGYDVPTKFRTDDYGSIPPVADDYRRTLWWEPDLVADGEGNASVEFYNNYTCTQMYVSAEGMTGDGKFVTTK